MKKLIPTYLKLIPRSFDVIGDILLFNEFPEKLKTKERKIGTYLLNKFRNIKVIAYKTRSFSGVYRLQKVKIIAGEKRKETIHKESNVKVELNIEKCYFSPRLSTERLRIAKQVKKGESILVMFSGVGIFPLVIAKNSGASKIYGIEINKVASKYAEENLKLNRVMNIKLFNGDVRKIMPKLKIRLDRILMPFPSGAEKFLDLAFNKIKKNGIIHFYDFLTKEQLDSSLTEKIKKLQRKFKLLKTVKCGQISPRKFRVCYDIRVL